ncbi:Endonuclease/exonuclease/phosphatase superfamily [Sesbania bispinosa]|nr:Endonuclease/exonuclease/phosphatase superfamily [Sesbania bispinosa]
MFQLVLICPAAGGGGVNKQRRQQKSRDKIDPKSGAPDVVHNKKGKEVITGNKFDALKISYPAYHVDVTFSSGSKDKHELISNGPKLLIRMKWPRKEPPLIQPKIVTDDKFKPLLDKLHKAIESGPRETSQPKTSTQELVKGERALGFHHPFNIKSAMNVHVVGPNHLRFNVEEEKPPDPSGVSPPSDPMRDNTVPVTQDQVATYGPSHHVGQDVIGLLVEDECKILTWNIRGAMSLVGRRHTRELIHHYRPSIVTILETQCLFHKVGRFWNKLGFQKVHIVEVVGHAGGIWVMVERGCNFRAKAQYPWGVMSYGIIYDNLDQGYLSLGC